MAIANKSLNCVLSATGGYLYVFAWLATTQECIHKNDLPHMLLEYSIQPGIVKRVITEVDGSA